MLVNVLSVLAGLLCVTVAAFLTHIGFGLLCWAHVLIGGPILVTALSKSKANETGSQC